MLKKYALKVSNTFSTVNYNRPTKSSSPHSSRSSSSDDGGNNSSRCSFDSNYDQTELNRNLFIENYLIGRGSSHNNINNNIGVCNKMRSGSLTLAEDALKKDLSLKRNNRRKSLMEKRDERLKINRNHLFVDKTNDSNKIDRAILKHRISSADTFSVDDDDNYYYDIDDEKNLSCDIMESSVPTLTFRKINNILRESMDFELSIVHDNA
jgi:hypothetical protein